MISKYQRKRVDSLELDQIEGNGVRYYFGFKNNDNNVLLNIKDDRYSCTCWHFANRAVVNETKYGPCVHVMAVVKAIVEVEN